MDWNQPWAEARHMNSLTSLLDVNLSNVFAFPFGGLNDYNKSTLKILNDLNIKNVLLSNNVMNFYGAGNINNVKYLDRFSPSNNKYYFIYRILKNIII